MSVRTILLDEFNIEVHSRMQGDNDDEIDDIVSSLLDEHPNWESICLNAALDGDTEERIIDALVRSDKIKCIIIPPNEDVSSTEAMLRKAVTSLPNLMAVSCAISLTEAQTERILSILGKSATLTEVVLFLGVCGDGIAKPFAKYLKESSSLETLAMTWDNNLDETIVASPMSQSSLSVLCDGIGECQSLKHVILDSPPTHDSTISETLSCAVSKSSSLEKLEFLLSQKAFIAKFCNSMKQSQAVKGYDLCFTRIEQPDESAVLTLDRNVPWKPLLSKEAPLALWTHILAKANTWNCKTSHSPLDALFFLTREKNDVLLQNVRRRKIRKRKRFQIS